MLEALEKAVPDIVALVATTAASLLAVVGWIGAKGKGTKAVAWIVVVIIVGGAAYQGRSIWRRVTSLRAIASDRMVPFGAGDAVTEISGSALLGESLFVVQDDGESVYQVARQGTGSLYSEERAFPLGIDISDLEAAEAHAGRIYAITSHSNTKSGKEKTERQWLLELEFNTASGLKVSRSQHELRSAILAAFNLHGIEPYTNLAGAREVMDIEGLAIDDAGSAYLGLRAPLSGESAIILRAPLQDLFRADPSLELLRVDLRAPEPPGSKGDERANGITALTFDPATKLLGILSNSPHRSERHTPRLWLLDPARLDPQRIANPELCTSEFSDRSYMGKPEALTFWPVPRPGSWLERIRGRLLGFDGFVEIFYDVQDAPALGQRFRRKELCPRLARLDFSDS